jgi:hypothetical protein
MFGFGLLPLPPYVSYVLMGASLLILWAITRRPRKSA